MNTSVLQKASPASKLTVSAMLCAVGLILPQIFHFIGGNTAGGIFLPMHIPVLLCGLICGWQWGAGVGIVLPLISSVISGMPVMFPTGVSMAAELCTYGAVIALVYRGLFRANGKTASVYVALVSAMLAGRAVSGTVKALLLMGAPNGMSMKMFISASFITAWPGIVIQLVLIPLIMLLLKKARLSVLK